MSTNADSEATAGPQSGAGRQLRIHRPCKTPAKTTSPRKILVVDDNKFILATTSAKLKAAGYEVLTAEDGGSAIRQARQLQPHLILLDLNFPPDVGHGGGIPWDGLLILSWLRRTNGMEKVPVIVITGGDLEKYQAGCIEAGVLDVFLKPIDHDALLASIRWALDDEVAEPPAPAPVDTPVEPVAVPAPVVETAARAKILFVDDANDWRYLALSYLGERGYEVATAEDPISAMLQISQFQPHLVVLDLNLAGQSAVTLLKLLSERHPEMPVVIYTGMDLDPTEVSQLMQLGAWNCLRKGSLEQLATTVEQTMSGPKPAFIPQPVMPTAAETETTSLRGPEIPGTSVSDCAEAAEFQNRLPSLEGLRMASTEELLSAVESAADVAPENIEVAPEPGVVISEASLQSAAESTLIIDHDAAFVETLRSFLESQSFRVSWVDTGAEALKLIAVVDVDLILFDLTLPDFAVQRFYEAVKAVKPHLCHRIIFMSCDESHPSDDGFVRRLNGISLWKPFPTDWLLEAIQTVRSGTHQHRLAVK